MLKALLVAQREFMENVSTKGFWIGLLIFPVILAASIVVPRLLDRTRSERLFVIVDRSGWLLDSARARLDEGGVSRRFRLVEAPAGDTSEAALNAKVGDDELFAYFVIGADPMVDNSGFRYSARNLADNDLVQWVSSTLTEVVRERKLARENIPAETARWIAAPVRFETRKVTAAGEAAEAGASDRLRQFAPIVFVYILWIAIFSISQMLMTNMIEEKSNRVVEVLLSSVSPVQLMAGKILGIAVTGLTIIGSWVLALILGVRYLPRLLGAPPTIDLAPIAGDPVLLGLFLLYFVLGFLFYAALLVAIGSVCNTLKEAQNLMGPVMLMLMVPILAMMPIGKDPNGMLAQVLSWIPPFTPFVMMNRAAGPPSTLEYVGTTVLLIVSIGVALWAAAKIFRVGILLTGKPPKFSEIVRWVGAR